jgi:hypothetical protein
VETAVVITHTPSGLRAEANETRSQAENQRWAIHRLRVNLALLVRTTPLTGGGQLWQSRVRGDKIRVSESHADFPALLAAALNQIAAANHDLKSASATLAISTTQVNAARIALGLHPLS